MKKKILPASIFRLFACSIFFTAILTLFIAPIISHAATIYYVSTKGNDASSGRQASPFRTIKFALGQLAAGDTLLIRGGTYAEKLESHNGTNFPSGTSWDNPVTIAAFPGEQVTLRGKMSIGLEKPLTQYVIFDGISIDAARQDSGISINGGAHHVRFINGEVKNAIGTSGITTSYHNDATPGNTSHQFIHMNVHHNGLDSSYYDATHQAQHRHGFYIKTSGNLIEHCEIHDNAGAGIHHYVRSQDPRANHNIYRNNVIYKNGIEPGRGTGITISRGDYNSVYNNVIWGNQNGITVNYIGNPLGTKVYNNTVYGNAGMGIGILSGPTGTKIINNISYHNSHNLIDQGTNTTISKNLTSNPLFMNVATADFRLQAESTNAIDKGIPLEEVKTDKEGTPRSPVSPDIGAYEYHLLIEAPKNLRVVAK